MNTFVNSVKNYEVAEGSRTANGMKQNASTDSLVLDFFGSAASARDSDLSGVFLKAMAENDDLAVRALLWLRDIRQGAGERQSFRNLLSTLEQYNSALAARLMPKVPELGRWDDLFAYSTEENKSLVVDMIAEALAKGDGLCAKWMPRKGPIAIWLRKSLGMSPRQYRKTLVEATKVVETQMCAKNWAEINFSSVPSVASARYQKAFGRNASAQYSAYLAELAKPVAERNPKVKINAGAIFPHDVIKSLKSGNENAANAQWDALPNFVGNSSIFPIVDTSGSMGALPFSVRSSYYYNNVPGVQPIEVALGLGLYVSSKLTSDFKDMLMIFDSTPKLLQVKGNLSTRVKQLPEIVSGSTNLHSAFDQLLAIAVKGKVEPNDMPESILILSDMQFNSCVRYDDSAIEMIRRKYATNGYELPKVIFWNLNAHAEKGAPVKFDEKGTCLVSGFSPSIMQHVLSNDLEDFTPYNVMLKTLSSSRYDY